MIKVNGIELKEFGLGVKKSDGWWNFPALKNPVINDWMDQDFPEISGNYDHLKFKSTKITFDCFILASGAAQFKSRLDTISALLQSDDPILLNYGNSSMARLVRLDKDASFRVLPSLFRAVAGEFKLVFEDVTPFNFQFKWTNVTSETLVFDFTTESPNQTPKIYIKFGNVALQEKLANYSQAQFTQVMATADTHNIMVFGDIDKITGIRIADDGGFVSDELASWQYGMLRRLQYITTLPK